MLSALFVGAIYMIATEQINKLTADMSVKTAATDEMTKRDAARSTLANDIRFHAEQSEGQLALLFFISEKEKRIPVYQKMDTHKAALDQAIEHITPLITGADEKEALTRLVKMREVFRDNLQETVDALELDDREKATKLLSTATQDNLKEIRGLVEHLIKEQRVAISAGEQDVKDRNAEAESALVRSKNIVIASSLGAATVGVLLGLLLMRNTARPE